jgi:nicotinamidase-related amidase
MKQALLVIDVQEALCRGEYAVFDAQGLVGRVNAMASAARAAQAPVIFLQHESKGPLLRHGSAGWQLAQGLHAVDGDDYFVRKTTPDSFLHTNLDALLSTLNVKALVIAGLQSEFCVDTTTRSALARGFPVVLVSDAHSTMDNGVLTAAQISAHHTKTLTTISSFEAQAVAMPAAKVTQVAFKAA